MRVHLMPDEKFIDTVIENSEALCAPNDCLYLVRKNKPFLYVHHSKARPLPLDSAELDEIIGNLGTTDTLYIHFLVADVAHWLAKMGDIKAQVNWIFWGAEFFQFMDGQMYSPLTQAYVDGQKAQELAKIRATKFSRLPLLNQWRRHKYLKKLQQYEKENRDIYQIALSKVDAFVHYNRLDYELVKSVFNFNASFQYFHYPAAIDYDHRLETLIAQSTLPIAVDKGKLNIWLANSATTTSNHLDALQAIKNSGLPDLNVWVPANYGDASYSAHLQAEAAKMLPGKVSFINDYMSFDMFAACIAAMDVSILWHKRSQAFGNVQMLLFLGKKIFMHPDSTLYQMLVKEGYKIWSVYDIDSSTLSTPLSPEDAAINKSKIMQEFSKSASKQTLQDCYAKH